MMNKLRIGYFADGPWSHFAFELIVENENIEIEFIVPRSDTKDKTLFEYAQRYGISYLENIDVNSAEFLKYVKLSEVDLLVSMSFNQIFKENIIKSTSIGIINCHAGKLPFYRGRNILNWALINDEKDFGITVHFVDEGIDTGDLILQRTFPITEDDTYETLLNIAYKECGMILKDALINVIEGNFKRIKQTSIDAVGFYCGQRQFGDELVDWQQSSRDLFNFVRAICHPGPRARTYINGEEDKEVFINKVKMIEGIKSYKGVPGQIIGKKGTNFIVKTVDTCLEILEMESKYKIKIGTRLKGHN